MGSEVSSTGAAQHWGTGDMPGSRRGSGPRGGVPCKWVWGSTYLSTLRSCGGVLAGWFQSVSRAASLEVSPMIHSAVLNGPLLWVGLGSPVVPPSSHHQQGRLGVCSRSTYYGHSALGLPCCWFQEGLGTPEGALAGLAAGLKVGTQHSGHPSSRTRDGPGMRWWELG